MSEVEINDFNAEKTAYFSRFAVRHLDSFRPHFRSGETLGKNPEVWRNVSEHCLVAGVFADILAEELHLPEDQRESTVHAAILHDWFKKHESKLQQGAKADGEFSLQTLAVIKAKENAALSAMGVTNDIIKLAGSNAPETEVGPQTLPEKIIWYVDAMLSNTNPVPIKQRFDDLERGWDGIKEDSERAERNKAFSELYRCKFNGKSLYEVQRELADKIGGEFAERIGYKEDIANLPIYLKEKLDVRIMQQ